MKRQTTNIKIDKELAYLLGIYCRLHQVKMIDVADDAIKGRLEGFEIKRTINNNINIAKATNVR